MTLKIDECCWLMDVEWFPKLKHISGTMMVAQVVACTNKLLVYERATALLGFFGHLWEPRKLSWATFWWNPTWLGNLLECPSIHRIIFEAPDESAAQKSSMIKTNISPLHLLRQYWDSLGSRFLWIHWNNGSIFRNILLGYSKKYCHWKHLWLNVPPSASSDFLSETILPVGCVRAIMFSAEPMEAMFHEHLTYPAISSSFPPDKKKIRVLSGKRLHNYGKSPFLMGKSTINGHFQ